MPFILNRFNCSAIPYCHAVSLFTTIGNTTYRTFAATTTQDLPLPFYYLPCVPCLEGWDFYRSILPFIAHCSATLPADACLPCRTFRTPARRTPPACPLGSHYRNLCCTALPRRLPYVHHVRLLPAGRLLQTYRGEAPWHPHTFTSGRFEHFVLRLTRMTPAGLSAGTLNIFLDLPGVLPPCRIKGKEESRRSHGFYRAAVCLLPRHCGSPQAFPAATCYLPRRLNSSD